MADWAIYRTYQNPGFIYLEMISEKRFGNMLEIIQIYQLHSKKQQTHIKGLNTFFHRSSHKPGQFFFKFRSL